MRQKDSFITTDSAVFYGPEMTNLNRKSTIKPKFLSFDPSQNSILDEEMRAQASFASFSSHGEDFTIQYCLKDE